MPLSSQYINEIRQLVNQRNTSPRGVADANNFFTTTPNQGGCNTIINKNDKEDGSCRYDVTITKVDIDTCTTKFIKDAMTKAVTITEHFGRMTIVPCDVAMALDCIAGQEQQQKSSSSTAAAVDDKIDNIDDDDDEDEEMNETKVNSSATTSVEVKVHDIEKVRSGIIKLQANVRGVKVRDGQTLDYDCMLSSDDDDSNDGNELDDDDDDIRHDDTGYDAENTATPIFDVAYPPIVGNIDLTDEQFKDEIFFSIFNNEGRRSTKCQIVIGRSCVPIGNGVPCSMGHIACDCEDRSDEEQEMIVMGMMKRATYAYLVAKLSC